MNTNPPLRSADSVEALGRVKASLAALAAGAALTRTSALHAKAKHRSGERSRRKEYTMLERSLTPNIIVTIGHHTRIYFAFVTTAPTELDSPATVTLHAATFVPPHDRAALERLLRYILRPAIVAERISQRDDGRVWRFASLIRPGAPAGSGR